MSKFYRKDWILYQEVANEGGKTPEALIEMNVKEDLPDSNKHVPYIEEIEDGYVVKCGKKEFHATDAEHHTLFIDLNVDNKYQYRQYIHIGELPEATFKVPKGTRVTAVAFCNLHGLWKSEL